MIAAARCLTVCFAALTASLLAGCDNAGNSEATTSPDTVEPAANGAQGQTPAKLTFVFQKQKDPDQIKEDASEVADFLTKELGIPVEVQVPIDYGMSVQALVSEKADVAYVSSIPFLLAKRDGNAELLLAEVRPDADGVDRTDYDSIFVVRQDSPLQSMQDIVENAGDIRMAFTSRTSTSGYVMAYRRLVNEGVLEPGQDASEVFQSADWAGSYTQALQQVADNRADLCAVSYYTLEGPTADNYLDEATRNKLRVVARTPGVPTHLICVRGGLSEDIKSRIKAALLKLSEERSELLADVYGAKELTEVDPQEHVQSTIEAFEYLQLPVESFVN